MSNAERFLLGATDEVIGGLQTQMMAYADALEFERAAEVRNQISALSRVLHQQSMEESSLTSTRDRDVDVLAVRVQGGRACVNLAMVRGGRHLGDRAHFPAHVEDAAALTADEAEERHTALTVEQQVLEAFIAQHYLGVAPPSLLVLSCPVAPELLAALSEQTGSKINVQHQPREQRKLWLEMAEKGAQIALARLLSEEGSQRERTRALVEALDLVVGGHGRRCASSASTSATPPVKPPRPAAWSMKAMPCARPTTAATTSTASPAVTTTPRCARC